MLLERLKDFEAERMASSNSSFAGERPQTATVLSRISKSSGISITHRVIAAEKEGRRIGTIGDSYGGSFGSSNISSFGTGGLGSGIDGGARSK